MFSVNINLIDLFIFIYIKCIMIDYYIFKRYFIIDMNRLNISFMVGICNILFDYKFLWLYFSEFESFESEEIIEFIYKNKNW